jgi:hypothetical protein
VLSLGLGNPQGSKGTNQTARIIRASVLSLGLGNPQGLQESQIPEQNSFVLFVLFCGHT